MSLRFSFPSSNPRSSQLTRWSGAARAFATVATLSLLPFSIAAAPPWPVALQGGVSAESRKFDGEIALYVEDLATGQRYTHNAATPMYLASGVKIVVMIAVFEEIAAGRLRWDETLSFSKADVRDGATVLKVARPGESFTVEQLMLWMMQQSDNAATDMLINRVGSDRVNAAAQRWGGPAFGRLTSMLEVRREVYRRVDPRVDNLSPLEIAGLRRGRALGDRARLIAEAVGITSGVPDGAAINRAFRDYYNSGFNSAPMEAVAGLLRAMERREVVDPAASQRMLEIMLGCRTGSRRIRAGLPDDALLAHKTGTQHRRMCDLGLVYTPDNRALILAICMGNYSKPRQAEAVIERLARRAYSLVVFPEGRLPPLPASVQDSGAGEDAAP